MRHLPRILPWAIAVLALLWIVMHPRSTARESSHTIVEALERVAKLSMVDAHVSDYRVRKDTKPLFGFLPINCEKALVVVYHGKVGAGFNLARGMHVETRPEQKTVTVQLPAPELLYVDVDPVEVVAADSSVCNAFTPEDSKRLQEESREALKKAAIAKGALDAAKTHARALLEGVAQGYGYQLTLEIGPDAKSAEMP